MRTSSRKRLLRWGAGLLILLLLAAGAQEWHRQHKMGITRDWARLVALPASAQRIAVSTEGGMFSRAFRISFDAPSADIERWLQDSPGTREAKIEKVPPNTRVYSIRPGGGAGFAEVTVDDSRGHVAIYVYWS